MVKEKAQAWADELSKKAAEGMIFRVIEVPDGWWVEQDCTEEWARKIYRSYGGRPCISTK